MEYLKDLVIELKEIAEIKSLDASSKHLKISCYLSNGRVETLKAFIKLLSSHLPKWTVSISSSMMGDMNIQLNHPKNA